MNRLSRFYDQYHQKNRQYQKLIRPNNFTYFYILQLLKLAGLRDIQHLKVLDVGCGVGTMSLYAASLGAAVTGVDVSPRAIEIAKDAQASMGFQKVTFKKGEVHQITKQFDVIFCFEVVEHVADEGEFLQQLRQKLSNDGLLLLSTPSLENWLYDQGFYQDFDSQVGHVRRYTVANLEKKLRKAGFQVILIRQVEGPLRNLLFTTRLGFLIRFIRGPFVVPFHWLDRLSGFILGYTDIQVIARKK